MAILPSRLALWQGSPERWPASSQAILTDRNEPVRRRANWFRVNAAIGKTKASRQRNCGICCTRSTSQGALRRPEPVKRFTLLDCPSCAEFGFLFLLALI